MFIIILIILLFLSLVLVWKGSGWLTDSMVPLAEKMGTSYIAVTTLFVSFLLSIPEIFTSLYASFLGHVNIGLGIIIGSVMANIGLTVGLSASFRPLFVEKSVVIRDGLYLIIAAIVVLLFGADLNYTRTEGWVMLVLFIPYAINVWFFEKHKPHTHRKRKMEKIRQTLQLIGGLPGFKLRASFFTFLLGAAILLAGSYLFSYSLIEINRAVNFPEILIGMTIGALGPVLPNIGAAIQGTRKGLKDAALTETFGSNIFTLLITLGIIIILSPLRIAAAVFYFDLTWMIIIHLLMIAFIFKGYHYREESLTRYEGFMLVFFYLALIMLHALWF